LNLVPSAAAADGAVAAIGVAAAGEVADAFAAVGVGLDCDCSEGVAFFISALCACEAQVTRHSKKTKDSIRIISNLIRGSMRNLSGAYIGAYLL
jgi:hypothetical protein